MHSLTRTVVLFCSAVVSDAATAQIQVSVETRAPSGVSLIDENGALQSLALPVGVPFTQQEVYRIQTNGTGSPYFIDYTETEVTPPLNVGPSAQNRVAFESRIYAKTNTLVSDLFTTDGNSAQPGTQRFRITITSPTPQNVNLDVWSMGQSFGNSSIVTTMTAGALNQSWTHTYGNGYTTDRQIFPVVVNGTLVVDVDITGSCTPGPGGNPYHDGYDTRWSLTVVPINTGVISYWGTGCGPATLGHIGTPTTGSQFTLNVANAPANAQVFFAIGTTTTFVPFLGLPLPLDMTPYGAPGCTLYIGSPAPWWIPASQLAGNNQLTLYLSPWLSNTWHIQGLVFDPALNNLGLQMTQAGTLNY